MNSPAPFIKRIITQLEKDVHIEWRSRYAFNGALAFVGAALLVVLYTLKAQLIPPTPRSGLIWIIVLFAAMSSLSRIFVFETDRRTFDLLRLNSRSLDVFLGKFIFNSLFTLVITSLSFIGFLFLLGQSVKSPLLLFIVMILGSIGLSAVSTLLAALISQASQKGTVFAVISMPLLLPLILLLVRLTKIALIEGGIEDTYSDLLALFGYCGVMISASVVLIEYIWED